jgi:hypothetical protein
MNGERRLTILEPMRTGDLPGELLDALKLPVPGTAAVLTFDPWRLLAVLSSGAVWRLGWRDGAAWRTETRECEMETNEVKFLAAGVGCGVLWVVTADRRIWTWSGTARAATDAPPVPGESRILAVEDGQRLSWAAGSWARLPELGSGKDGTPGMVRVRALSGMCLAVDGKPRDVFEGDVVEIPERDARPLLARRVLELADAVGA